MRARYYDPQVGRFISEDPIGFGGGDVNLYAYCKNNPILFVDPDGEFIQSLIAGGVAGGIVGGISFITELAKGSSVTDAAKSAVISGTTAGVSVGLATSGVGFMFSGVAASTVNAGMQKLLTGNVDLASATYNGFATSAGGVALALKTSLKGTVAGIVHGTVASPVNLIGNTILSTNSDSTSSSMGK